MGNESIHELFIIYQYRALLHYYYMKIKFFDGSLQISYEECNIKQKILLWLFHSFIILFVAFFPSSYSNKGEECVYIKV